MSDEELMNYELKSLGDGAEILDFVSLERRRTLEAMAIALRIYARDDKGLKIRIRISWDVLNQMADAALNPEEYIAKEMSKLGL